MEFETGKWEQNKKIGSGVGFEGTKAEVIDNLTSKVYTQAPTYEIALETILFGWVGEDGRYKQRA